MVVEQPAASEGDRVSTPSKPGAGRRPWVRRIPRVTRALLTAASVTAVLVVTTFVLGSFGFDDASTALTFPGRITGVVLIGVAVITVCGAVAVLDHWWWKRFPYSGMVALIGVTAAFLTNLWLLVKAVTGGDSAYYWALFGVLTAGSAWAVHAVLRTSVVIPAPKRVAAAVIISAVVPLVNFGYQDFYQPSQIGAKPVIRLTPGNPVLSQDRKAFAVPVDIEIVNRSEVGFYVLGAEFHAMGERVRLSTRDRLRGQWRDDAEQWSKYQERNPLSRREIHQPGELVSAEPWMLPGFWIEANDSFVTRTVVRLPLNTPYDQVAFYATANLAREDKLFLYPLEFKGYSWQGGKVPQWLQKGQKDFDSLVYRARVHENNALDDRLMAPRYASVYWKFGTHGAQVVVTITRSGEDNRVQNPVESLKLRHRYGLVDVQTGPIERTLWDIKSR